MLPDFREHPGLYFVAATLLPLASFVLLLLAGGLRMLFRPYRNDEGAGASLYQLFGGDQPGRTPAYVATGAIGLAFLLSVIGFSLYMQDFPLPAHAHAPHGERGEEAAPEGPKSVWSGSVDWAWVGEREAGRPATVLRLGYRIDSLTAVMFLMVTLVATLIHLFSIGYMSDELGEGHHGVVADHQVHTEEGHLHRRGRFGRFFLFLSLFCFSMLNLVLADNLFQVFVSWELVGICSYLLIGFYYERDSASMAANKAFITNRIGDSGFIIGLMILWTYVGTFNFQELFQQVPQRLADGSLPHWLLVVAGLGIFLGCVGKSAQFPLHVWLPDAMEGPTPVSALIHAATMVAAGVYLVGRVFPLFTPEARLVIAYTGGITLFVAATIAVVMTDIKKVLAYSTVSQLGYMMLALGVGGWVAGLFHLLTHAFFKALLFLGSGSVIYGCHHEQDMLKMGGLYPKMKVTALTMLTGVLAIAGTPLFSGWYSKDAIVAHAMGFGLAYKEHLLLFLLPLVTAGITTFYMFRMWFLTFTGRPRDEHVHEHAHESPWPMTVPLVVLACFSVVVAWGWPAVFWDAEASLLGGHGGLLEASYPGEAVQALNAHLPADSKISDAPEAGARYYHREAGLLASGMAGLGFLFAGLLYWPRWQTLNPDDAVEQFPGVHRFLAHKWYFDEFYRVALVRPALVVAGWFRAFDTYVIDGFLDWLARATVVVSSWDGRFDFYVIDGLVNLTARVVYGVGGALHTVQTGYIRSYILFLVLAAVGIFILLSYFVTATSAG